MGVTNAGASLTLAGVISGPYNLTTVGAGTLVLKGANTFGGPGDAVTVTGSGTLRIAADSALGDPGNSLVMDGGTLNTTANLTTNRDLVAGGNGKIAVNPGTTLTWDGPITGSGNLDIAIPQGSTTGGAMVLGGSNTFTGTLAIDTGVVKVASPFALAGGAGTTKVDSGGTLDLAGVAVGNGSVALNGGQLINSSAVAASLAGAVTVSGSSTLDAIGSGGLTLSGPMNAGASLLVEGTHETSLTGAISGNGGFTKVGSGTLFLGGSNSFGGGILVSAGTVQLGNVNGLGSVSSTTTIAGGALDFNGFMADEPLKLVSGNTTGLLINTGTGAGGTSGSVAITNPVTITASAGALVLSGSIFNSASLTVSGNGQTVLGTGVLSGPGTLVKTGLGDLVLSGSNTYTGATTVGAGTVTVGSNYAFGSSSLTTVNAGAMIDMNGFTTSEPINLVGGGLASEINNSAATPGILNGAVTVSGAAGPLVMATGAGGLVFDGPVNMAANLEVTGPNTITMNGPVNGVGELKKFGTGTLILAGTNSYTGGMVISQGVVRVTSATALGSVLGVTNVLSGASLDIQGNGGVEPVTVTGMGVGQSGAILNGGGGTSSFGGPITLAGNTFLGVTGTGTLNLGGYISGPWGVTKVGAGTLALNADEFYTGSTTINAGTLILGAGNNTLPVISKLTSASVAYATVQNIAINGGTLDLDGFVQAVGAISQSGPQSAATITSSAPNGTWSRTAPRRPASTASWLAASISSRKAVPLSPSRIQIRFPAL